MDGTTRRDRPDPKPWWGIGIRLAATLLFLLLILALNRCNLPNLPSTRPTATAPAVETGRARLLVQVRPEGASVFVDRFRSGTTPVSLELAAGQHLVRVELEGFVPLTRTVDLAIGAEEVVQGELAALPSAIPLTLTPTGEPTREISPVLPDLAVQSVRIELETGGACDYASTRLGLGVVVTNAGDGAAGPFVVEGNGVQQRVAPGLAPGQSARLWFEGYNVSGENLVVVDDLSEVQESDEGNNLFAQMVPIPTLPPTCTPPPAGGTPSPTTEASQGASASNPESPPVATVSVREGQVGIPTYPYAAFVSPSPGEPPRQSFPVLDWGAYEASNPSPQDVTYRSLVVENEVLQLTFLPDLGGRIYEVVFKPTGHRETYRNPVLKPTHWGPPEQGWWLAAGGIEWCLPVAEHGYEWGIPWTAEVSRDARGVTVTMLDTRADDRLRARIAVRLEAGAGSFTIQPRLENPTGAPLSVQYWTNAMLAPGGRNAPSADLRFVLPEAVTSVTVHSRGDDGWPNYNERLPWPVHDGLDLSRLGNWNRWLGFFEDPAAGGFVAVYDEAYDEGMVRVFAEGARGTRGAKVFGLGWRDPIPAANWTDDDSGYVEIHGGPAPTFDGGIRLPPGDHLQWTEVWYPVAGLGGLRFANGTAALNLKASDGKVQLAVATTRAWSGDIVLSVGRRERWRQAVSMVPGHTYQQSVALGNDLPSSGQLAVRLEGRDGNVVAEYTARLGLE